MSLNLTKSVQTRGGMQVRILCTDCKDSEYPIVGLVTTKEGEEYPETWTIDGKYYDGDDVYDEDLVNVARRIRGYIYFYRATNRDGWYVGCFEPSLKDFLPSATNKAVARLRVDIQEGQYDE